MTAGYETDGERVAALLDVEADPLSRPLAGVTSEREGTTVAATSDAWRKANAEDRAVVTTERVDDAGTGTVAEQLSLLRGPALWNAVASFGEFADGVETVRLRTAEHAWTTHPFGADADRVSFRLRGGAYRATLDRDP